MKISISIVLTASFAFLNAWGEGIEAPKGSEQVVAKAPCGLSGPIKERISSCSTKKSLVSRDRQSRGYWRLVTRTNKGFEVWRDDLSGDLWSDWLEPVNPFYKEGEFYFPRLLESEIPGACSASSELKELGLTGQWYLPSYGDFQRAESHGSLSALPHFLRNLEPWMDGDRTCFFRTIPYATSTPYGEDEKERFYQYWACTNTKSRIQVSNGGFNRGRAVRCIQKLNGEISPDSLVMAPPQINPHDKLLKAGLSDTVVKNAQTAEYCSEAGAMGFPCRMEYKNAVKYCRDQGMHLPTAKEFARLLQSLGSVRISTDAPETYLADFIEAKNLNGAIDRFYISTQDYKRLSGDLGSDWFWMSSTDKSGYPLYFNGYFGKVGPLFPYDNNAVRCASGHE
jgi:hypothetical protein